MSATLAGGTVAVVQVVLAVVAAPLLLGVVRQVRAVLEGRAGAGVLQPWRDLRKLCAKETLQAAGTTPVQWLAPGAVLVTGVMLAALVPTVATAGIARLPADLFVVVSVLLVGTVALGLLGLDAGTAFGGMGSSRHLTIAALVEPTVLLAVYALSVPVGSTSLGLIVAGRAADPSRVVAPAGVLAVVALAVAVIAETARLPVDNPATHLELTMVHEAMVLESSGRDLAALELGSWLRLSVLLALVANLVLPWGVAMHVTAGALALGVVAVVAKTCLLGAVLGAVEVFLAKVRLFRVPDLLTGSFVLAFLAVTGSFVIG
ncbi:MAG TPA: NADH-quinone oxidoreductase subunit H [Kineosporiaceae bacterium]